MRHAIGRLQFRWWGRFWRGWCQFEPRINTCADKDHTIEGRGFIIGPFEFTWWSRRDWQDFCFTQEEADAADAYWRSVGKPHADRGDAS